VYADRLLGRLLDTLKSTGLYGRSLIVVAADHGASFWPGQRYRGLSGTSHPEDIFSVPLIIRAPDQARGEVSDVAGETIDILPTIADVLDIELPWKVDGCSLFDSGCPPREERRVYAQTPEGPIELIGYPLIAFSIDGEIRVVAPAPLDGSMDARIIAMLPEAVASRVPHGLNTYLVECSEGSPSLRPLSIE
jgi:hypothetical protein